MSDEEDVDDFRVNVESGGLHIDARCDSDNAAAKSALENLRDPNYNGPGRVRDTHELLCPNHLGECLAVPYTNAQFAAVLEAAAYETYLRSIMIVREQELEQQFRNDLERTLAERQQESDIDRHIRVNDLMLTLRCPNSLCRRALIDFDGCTALTCDLCDRAFCGLC
ncbi:hypothetical protein SARC_01274 [Sphaeroforma arctica JP610]|uniref:IBR domain-containing protein n=1 Tax=Sphaeroforma arctica JP610 TaxID=667725 RepID=A0A0L0GED4_9EUKA|nr:hypothetical protein SARC_01274 [Sphaeroforma arctica JP610]KNC86593.1 hypothetical protein SARC_01274 [Sphaeroforma arctica JP610]|eukprot:XP_014160495.1 hypothetical protein SARC_01274 [Sphaeroforma arctica JP610]